MTRTQGFACVAGVAALVGMTVVVTSSRSPVRIPRQPPPAAAEAIPNGSFESITGDVPDGWRRSRYQGRAEYAVDSAARTGSKSVRITSQDGADAAWSAIVAVTPFSRYRLSGWIKTENLRPGTSRGALLNLHGLAGLETRAVAGTTDWTRVELEFDSEANDGLQVNCLFGGWGRASGTAWFDDIRLERLSTRAVAPAVAVDAAKTGPEMSPYIYGQFIEHLGRCINGGLWAEMIEDRKFYYAVGDSASPWRVVGDAGRVRMSGERPYLGAHPRSLLQK
jgi:alpha-N-arabinofuranosidase